MKFSHVMRNGLLAGVVFGLLTGCSWLSDWDAPSRDDKISAAAPDYRVVATDNVSWLEPVREQAHTQPKGIVTDEDAARRIAALEREVEMLRNDLKMIMPALTKIASMQGSIHSALGQIEPAAGHYPQPVTGQQPARQAPVMMHGDAQSLHPQGTSHDAGDVFYGGYGEDDINTPAAHGHFENSYAPVHTSAGHNNFARHVDHLRFGVHHDKTRLVMDTSDMVAFSYNVDNGGHVVTVDLPDTGWRYDMQKTLDRMPLVRAYRVEPQQGGGHRLILEMHRPVEVLWAQSLPPNGQQGSRVVIDVAAI